MKVCQLYYGIRFGSKIFQAEDQLIFELIQIFKQPVIEIAFSQLSPYQLHRIEFVVIRREAPYCYIFRYA